MSFPEPGERHEAAGVPRRFGGAAAAPLAARAQQAERVRRLAAMMGGRNADTDPEGAPGSRLSGKACRNWDGSKDAIFAPTTAGLRASPERMRVIAKEFVDLQARRAVCRQHAGGARPAAGNPHIPIVFTNLSDPVGTGVVTSFARPGGNATGFTAYEYSLAGKWLEMLKEVAPAARQVALLSIRRPPHTPIIT